MPSLVFALLSDLHGRLLDPSLESEDWQQFLASAWSVSIIIVLHHTRLLSTISPLWTCSATRDRIWRLCNGLVYVFKTNLRRVFVKTPVVFRAWSDFVCALFRRLSEIFYRPHCGKMARVLLVAVFVLHVIFLSEVVVPSLAGLEGMLSRNVYPNLLLLQRSCYWIGIVFWKIRLYVWGSVKVV